MTVPSAPRKDEGAIPQLPEEVLVALLLCQAVPEGPSSLLQHLPCNSLPSRCDDLNSNNKWSLTLLRSHPVHIIIAAGGDEMT